MGIITPVLDKPLFEWPLVSSQGAVQQGFWKTENKLFYTSDTGNAPWMNIGEYLIDNQNMMFKQPSGNQLWERIR
ncbi:hypothetical protein N9L94_07135 [Robiginitalea sp.]|nr:hypothetical protein [Robiginitalea sp.]